MNTGNCLGFLEAAGRDRRGPDADAAGDEGLLRVEGDHVLVDRDAGDVQGVGHGFACGAFGTQVDEHQVIVRPAGNDAESAGGQFGSEFRRIEPHLMLIGFEFIGERLFEAHGLGGDDVLQRSALKAGENGGVDRLDVLLSAEDQTAPGAAERLVRGRGDHVAVGHGIGMFPRRDEPCDMGHVDEKFRSHLVGDLAEPREVDDARIGAGSGEDHLRLVRDGQFFDLVVVDALGLAVDAVGDHVVELAGEVQRVTVGQVAAVVETHGQHRVARLAQRRVDGLIRAAAGVGLHVGGFRAEELLYPFDGDGLHLVDVGAAVVVALAGIALGIFVGQHGTLGRPHGAAGEVFAGDEFDAVVLTFRFAVDALGDLGIGGAQRGDVVISQRFHFLEAADVAFGLGEGDPEPDVEQGDHLLVGEQISGEDQHVGVVVFAAGTHADLHIGHDGADAVETVGNDPHANARGADDDADVGFPGADHSGRRGAEIRVIVIGILGVRPAVRDLEPLGGQIGGHLVFQLEAAVIGGDRNGERFAVKIDDFLHDEPLLLQVSHDLSASPFCNIHRLSAFLKQYCE